MNTIVTQDMKHAMACFGTGVTPRWARLGHDLQLI
jgi:hypothetical protein